MVAQNYRTSKKVQKRKLLSGKLILSVLAGLIVLGAVFAGLQLTHTTHFFQKAKPVSGPIPIVEPQTSPKSKSSNSSSANQNPAETEPSSPKADATTPVTGGGGGATLVAPYGSFVSNHQPGQHGSPLLEQSECNTTPGASCYIKFTQGSIVKTLTAQTIGSSGSTSWLWYVNKAGLTSGDWKISAVATLNGQTKVTQDPVALEVE
jgi:hypothetical protein